MASSFPPGDLLYWLNRDSTALPETRSGQIDPAALGCRVYKSGIGRKYVQNDY